MVNVGIDWAQTHPLRLVILTDDGERVKQRTIHRSEQRASTLMEEIRELDDETENIPLHQGRHAPSRDLYPGYFINRAVALQFWFISGFGEGKLANWLPVCSSLARWGTMERSRARASAF